jgi:hypothetical protein
VLAAALAWMTTTNVGGTTQSLPMGAKTTRAGLMEAGQRIMIDPATGQARPIEHDDVSLIPTTASAVAEPQTITGPNGEEGVLVPDTADVYTVATKAPDGTVSIGHAAGLPDAQRKMQATDAARRSPAQKEVLNDR